MNQALSINSDFLHDLSIIAEDEGLLKRVARYVKKLAKEHRADPTLMSEEEFFAKIERAEREIAEGKGITFTNKNDVHAWLNSL